MLPLFSLPSEIKTTRGTRPEGSEAMASRTRGFDIGSAAVFAGGLAQVSRASAARSTSSVRVERANGTTRIQ